MRIYCIIFRSPLQKVVYLNMMFASLGAGQQLMALDYISHQDTHAHTNLSILKNEEKYNLYDYCPFTLK